MKISKLESALILTEALVELGPHAHEKEIYDEVYAFLDYAEEQASEHEELDEEVELELTPAGDDFMDRFDGPYNIESEFNEFSPSVGTFEGTETLQDIVAPYFGGHKRAPVAERVHVPFSAAKTIGEAFQPCGAD